MRKKTILSTQYYQPLYKILHPKPTCPVSWDYIMYQGTNVHNHVFTVKITCKFHILFFTFVLVSFHFPSCCYLHVFFVISPIYLVASKSRCWKNRESDLGWRFWSFCASELPASSVLFVSLFAFFLYHSFFGSFPVLSSLQVTFLGLHTFLFFLSRSAPLIFCHIWLSLQMW